MILHIQKKANSFTHGRICLMTVVSVFTMWIFPYAATITDMAGRTLTIPDKITKVYSTSPMGQILMYTLDPEKIAGHVYAPSEQEKKFLLESYLNKPLLGGWYGKNTTGNPENIINAAPDIILSMGELNETDKTFSDRMQKQLNIPVIMVSGSITKLDSTYRYVGRLIGDSARGDILSTYCKNIFKKVRSIVDKIPQDKRIRVYYAEGLEGLETDSKGSLHAEVLDITGGINVADIQKTSGFGRVSVSIEQLIVWNPELMIVGIDQGFAHGDQNFEIITTSAIWKNVLAVKKNQVYKIPSVPFGWFDRPPSVNRMIGMLWLVNLLYPDEAGIDIRSETKKFYSEFYHRELSENELDSILNNAVRKK
jgi:iron complex transport system substrate-binding protein